eukprot:GGOE01012936.1.p1 GENE.GGOE01012936.1~~GGOE01012936.1.p1  ORF type:complete len:118 (+),score=7.77 GGOE01012936.1:49-402(+)
MECARQEYVLVYCPVMAAYSPLLWCFRLPTPALVSQHSECSGVGQYVPLTARSTHLQHSLLLTRIDPQCLMCFCHWLSGVHGLPWHLATPLCLCAVRGVPLGEDKLLFPMQWQHLPD